MAQKIKKVRLLKDQRPKIVEICVNYVYNTQKWKEALTKLYKKEKEFTPYITELYEKFFNIDENLKDFSKKFGMDGCCSPSLRNKMITVMKDPINITEKEYKKFYSGICLREYTNYSNYDFYLPFFRHLSWMTFETFNKKPEDVEDCYYIINYIDKKFSEFMKETKEELLVKYNESINILEGMIKILNSCVYQEEVKELLPIPEVINFIDTIPSKVVSTALCTLDKTDVDFIKNYIDSQK